MHLGRDCYQLLSSNEATTMTLDDVVTPTAIDSLIWLAQTFKVLSLLMTSLTFLDSLWARSLTSPVPLSFHSLSTLENRKSLALLFNQLYSSNTFDVPVEIGSHLEQNLLIFLVGLCFNLFSELDDGLELGVVLLSLLCVCNRCGWSG